MRRGMSSLVYARTERLHPGLLDRMVAGGAEVIEIFGSRGHFNYSDRQHVREIANWFSQHRHDVSLYACPDAR